MIILDKKKRADHLNISVKPEIVEEFKKYAEKKGILISPFVAAKMKEFIEEEKALEELKNNKR